MRKILLEDNDPLSWVADKPPADASSRQEDVPQRVETQNNDENRKEEVEEVMAEENKVENDTGEAAGETVVLDEDMSIVQVARFRQTLLSSIDSGKDIVIDAEKVEEIDAAGLQLLLAFVKAVKNAGRSVQWQSPSAEMLSAIDELAMAESLDLDA